ncbi:hypothetical protein [Nocardia wallacei]|uniref:hypothetical protein n=1 Tax=Nocardia wallacei TaxID=480035 RepID=UPI002455DAF1|nr:hypothetical protein [Nocardia wallacei]
MSTPTASGVVNDHGGPAPELDQLIAALRVGGGHEPQLADQLVAAASEWRRPPRIQVTGRAPAGKTTLLQALALM